MHHIGFSTGALALADFRSALEMLHDKPCDAVELSALRHAELQPLVEALETLDLTQFAVISFHAPSKIDSQLEQATVELLLRVAQKGWLVVVHPDAISNFGLWGQLGRSLTLENMDKRKSVGRYAYELAGLFEQLPQAAFCFDIGHARQVDPSMAEAGAILRQFHDRLRLIHISEVNSQSKHDPLSLSAFLAFKKVTHLIPDNVPVIIESRVTEQQIEREVKSVAQLLTSPADRAMLAGD
jgi:hypothetical protein